MRVKSASGRRAAVASGHPLASAAAKRILEDGGNTVDAAVAGAAVLAVALPQACAIGGDLFALVHASGRTYGINASGPSPRALPRDVSAEQLVWGPLSCAVPGMMGGWELMHRRFGSQPWRRVLADAIRIADEGVPVAREFARAMKENFERLRLDPGASALYLKNGQPYAEGENLQQPALAATLSAVAEGGCKTFYEGQVGERLCAAIGARGGALKPDDLAAYAPLTPEPLAVTFRGRTVRVMPPNSYGLVMLMQLAALESVELAGHGLESAERLRFLMTAARASFQLGRKYIADPSLISTMLGEALGPANIAELRMAMKTPAQKPAPTGAAFGTSVITVVDSAGDGVSIVQSVFAPFGGVVADPETGIIMNNRLFGFSAPGGGVNAPAPGKRPAHTLNPALAFEDGRLALALATPGGSGQTITLTQVLTNVIDLELTLDAAIDAPRWSMDLQGNFALEQEFGAGMVTKLDELGIEARIAKPEQRFFFGSAECASIAGDGALTAVSDFRREGGAAAL